MTDNQHILQLLDRFEKGLATEAELAELDAWYNAYENDETYTEGLTDTQQRMVQQNMLNRISQRLTGPEQGRTSTFKLWQKIAVAAAISCLVFGVWFFNFRSEKDVENTGQELVQDVAPGKQGATLTLASGKKIRLSDALNGKLAEEAGVEISKTENGQLVYRAKDMKNAEDRINTISTTNGETYIIILPDGSKAWLNSASSLTYNASLVSGGKRHVRLQGEGYFEVAKDKNLPFVVETDKQLVEVLGTHFNVNAYKDEPLVATTLVEGSVKVSAGTASQVIKPGEQALSEGEKISIRKANLENITDWKDGDFNLDGIDFEVAMRKIARWYDVEIVYEDNIQKHLETGGWIARDKRLSVVLKAIEELGIARFRVDGHKVYARKYESK